MFWIKVVEKNQNTHFVLNNFRVFYEIICKNMVEPEKPQITV
jgi:hypothetical protein